MYQFEHTPKSIISGSFDFGDDLVVTIIDDPDVLKKCASSKIVAEWGDLKPKKNHSIIHLAALGTEESVGPNRNGDAFRNEFLKVAHPTFLKYGALYREHQTDGEFRKEGSIERSAHNEEMGRTELAVSADHDKCGDWLAKIEKGKRVDFSMGFDCFDPSTKIKTDNGLVCIKDLREGDLVLTHAGRFMPVLRLLPSSRAERRVLEVKMQTSQEPLLATEDHRLFVVPRNQVKKNQRDRWGDHLDRMSPEWIEARNVSAGDYLVRPVIQLRGTSEITAGTAYMLGQYLGDGCISKDTDNSVAITTHVRDDDILSKMVSICLENQWDFSVDYLNYDRELYRKKEAIVLRIREPEFARLCERFCGRLKQKKLSPEVWDLDLSSAMSLLGGYVDADGSYSHKRNNIRTCSVLDDLNETVQQLLFSCGIVATSWKDWFGEKEGGFSNLTEYANILHVNKSDSWKLNGYSVKVEPGETVRAQECIFFERDGLSYLACPISSVSVAESQPDEVFCLTVSEDHSFVAEGAVVHNCEYDVCSICGNKAPTRKEYCKCVKKGAKKPYGMNRILPDGRKCYVINPKGKFNDISQVGVGADMTAQHLRKVAGLIDDDEVLGGAELMERLFPKSLNKTAAEKARVIEKLSRMEKTVPVTSFKLGDEQMLFGKKAAKSLRGIPDNGMFAEMAKLGTLLPIRQFYRTVMGEMFDSIEPYVNEAEKVAHLAVSFIDENEEIKHQVCRNSVYDTQKSASVSLPSDDVNSLVSHFSVTDNAFFDQMQEVTRIGSRQIKVASMSEVSEQAKGILAEYGAYKVAFMLALGEDSSESTWRAVAMTY